MRLFVIRRPPDDCDYDEHDEAVIRAETEEDVRKIAAEKLLPFAVWLNPGVIVSPIDHDGPRGIVVASFNAG